MLKRELQHREVKGSFSTELIGWIEVSQPARLA
jgi:hypothetical protein